VKRRQDIINGNKQMTCYSFCQFFSFNLLKIPPENFPGYKNFTACTNYVSDAHVFTERKCCGLSFLLGYKFEIFLNEFFFEIHTIEWFLLKIKNGNLINQ